MGCTPSIQVNQSGVVRCSQDDDSNGNSQLIGVQGNFRATDDGVEGTSRETQQDSILLQDLSPYEEDIFKGSVFFQKNEAEEKENTIRVTDDRKRCYQTEIFTNIAREEIFTETVIAKRG
ncbi:PDE8 domain-containing protein [Trichonephila inaurata madagascariensis]|uniref:PDE8 domain-containing protein n=1 Tax=Trichonephila inaurata madagascariensis TaxID=2747483 RepID=A0A8X7CIU0_9ARAC|nr:PDE8 domain-containing protein [Trichonephila inaurata madagascariensis]